jgi:hypothetical protein
MEELRPSSGPTMGVLTFGGRREPTAIGFLGFSLTRNDTPGPVVLWDCEIYRKLVFMANYPLERREDL